MLENDKIENILKTNGLSIEILKLLSFETKLGSSLKKELKMYDKNLLFDELSKMIEFYDQSIILSDINADYRIKSFDSILLKYDRHIDNNMEIRKVYNDILGFRAFCDSYEDLLQDNIEQIRIVDMTKGKINDDGYRGVHIYFQKDNNCYPIEIQFNTLYDRQLNNWLHDYVYKKNYSNETGQKLRFLYEEGKIKNEEDFKKELEKCVI